MYIFKSLKRLKFGIIFFALNISTNVFTFKEGEVGRRNAPKYALENKLHQFSIRDNL